ncbi:allantoate deiminase 2 [Impatiens glandulifera]|uniref:allantoate deiminase 2 n=1 Tax=Impatiens glandulifera TaxID=253017 RepID=UPI001FB144E4|nr:allantoate deiminase 2 [Impatiens glandulifera]
MAPTCSFSSNLSSFLILPHKTSTTHMLISLIHACILLSLLFADVSANLLLQTGIEDANVAEIDQCQYVLRDEAVMRLNELGKVSDADGYLERTFLSSASLRAAILIRQWMEDSGLKTWVDLMGNVHGRVEGMNATSKALLIGSHLDTVIDAGKFDGALGIVSALSALKVLKISGQLESLKHPVEVIAFSDEEGVRFQSTFLGSAAIAGVLPVSALQTSDKSGVTVQDVLNANSIGISEESLSGMKYDPDTVWGYVEVHIEQGPVLESVGLPLGAVKGIAGQSRLKVTIKGSQGHAGTVPMWMRRDPMAASAELIVLLESLCKQPEKFLSYDEECKGFSMESFASSLVCTVGEISTWPSASNVIPGEVAFTIDVRAMDDMGREAIIFEFSNRMHEICDKRSVSCNIDRKHDANAIACDDGLSAELKVAANAAMKKIAGDIIDEVPVLMSGAGHDAMAIAHLTKVGMLFVRCRGGISHSPAEHVSDDDVWAAGLAVLAFLQNKM